MLCYVPLLHRSNRAAVNENHGNGSALWYAMLCLLLHRTTRCTSRQNHDRVIQNATLVCQQIHGYGGVPWYAMLCSFLHHAKRCTCRQNLITLGPFQLLQLLAKALCRGYAMVCYAMFLLHRATTIHLSTKSW